MLAVPLAMFFLNYYYFMTIIIQMSWKCVESPKSPSVNGYPRWVSLWLRQAHLGVWIPARSDEIRTFCAETNPIVLLLHSQTKELRGWKEEQRSRVSYIIVTIMVST